MAVQIQFRRDTAANWTSSDPTMAEGEIGLETDTNKFKFGDGSTAWTGLSYFAGGGLLLTDDGTYYVISYLGTKLFKIRKSDGQFMIAAGLDTDVSL